MQYLGAHQQGLGLSVSEAGDTQRLDDAPVREAAAAGVVQRQDDAQVVGVTALEKAGKFGLHAMVLEGSSDTSR
jgi:hypothetical protein